MGTVSFLYIFDINSLPKALTHIFLYMSLCIVTCMFLSLRNFR